MSLLAAVSGKDVSVDRLVLARRSLFRINRLVSVRGVTWRLSVKASLDSI